MLRYVQIAGIAVALSVFVGANGLGCKKQVNVGGLPAVNATVPASFVQHKAGGATLKAPPTWTASPSPGEAKLILMAPDGRTSVNLIISPAGKTDISEVPTRSAEELKKAASSSDASFTLGKAELVNINSEAASRVTYSMTFSGVPLRGTQYLFLKKGQAYILTYTAPTESYDQFQSTAEQIAVSLSVP
jgi:hypothetical protein